MSNKIISGGIASEYDDQIIWIDRPEVGADAAQIIDETEYTPKRYTMLCSMRKVMRRRLTASILMMLISAEVRR